MNLQAKQEYCANAHGDQKYGNTATDDGGMDGYHPYSVHLAETAAVARRFGVRNLAILTACWGHDMLEDTDKTIEDLLKAGFNPYEVALIWACTDGDADTRAERKFQAYRKIRMVYGAVIVKLCDRIANVEHAAVSGYQRKYELYRDEMPEFEWSLRDLQTEDETVRHLWKHLNWLFSVEARDKLWATRKCCGNAAQQ
ncbi:MAG: hypothetical protein JST44_21695 [Cyanobacteria bacterium SZAS LIN-5]|nr:hypothetical protein [Cyanobacteria bacterium SZAS LIN-5]